jgi:apolipoprotein D and lipocalin family protein
MAESILNKYLITILSLLFAMACLASEPVTVSYVDLQKYQGTWYEIARIPAYFQKECVGGTMAQYKINTNNTVDVVNSCDRKGGFRKIAKGNARIKDAETNAKLEVSFVRIFGKWIYAFGGDYWILYLDENYEHVIVGHPDRTYGWILARSSVVTTEKLKFLESELRRQGYDTCKLLTTRQIDGFDNEYKLCEVVLQN